jgi:predicted membrane channel-forming protein YqfA (hemolysin III family)
VDKRFYWVFVPVWFLVAVFGLRHLLAWASIADTRSKAMWRIYYVTMGWVVILLVAYVLGMRAERAG